MFGPAMATRYTREGPCVHDLESDPWRPNALRCIYCEKTVEDIFAMALPDKAPLIFTLKSSLVRTLRHSPLFSMRRRDN